MFQQVKRILCVGVVLAVAIVLIPSFALGSGTISIVGQVNDDLQIITDNDQVYEIIINDMGEELTSDHAGERVKVTGEVVEEGEDHSINVLSYEVIE